MDLEYNTAQPLLIISEYGRHVQTMALHLLTIKDKKERSRAAETVIQTMAQVQPSSKETEEWKRKLWDHLHIITGFKLEVESQYPRPEPEAFKEKPEQLQYPDRDIKYKHYGKIVEEMTVKARKIKNEDEQQSLVEAIACLMKKAYMTWNKTTVDDNTIIKDLKEMSLGHLILKNPACLNSVYVQLNVPQNKPNFQHGKNKKNNNRKFKKKNKNRNGGF